MWLFCFIYPVSVQFYLINTILLVQGIKNENLTRTEIAKSRAANYTLGEAGKIITLEYVEIKPIKY